MSSPKEYKEEINKVEEENQFESDYLMKELDSLLRRNTQLTQFFKKYPKISKKNMLTILNPLKNLCDALKDIDTQTLLFTQDTINMLITEQLNHEDPSKNNENRERKDYETHQHIKILSITLQQESNGCDLYQLEKHLQAYYSVLSFVSEFLKKDSGGRPPSTLPYVMLNLISIYEIGTGSKAISAWDSGEGNHKPLFYKFLIALKPILEKLGINLGTSQSIATNAKKAIKHYKQLPKSSPLLAILSKYEYNCV